MKTKYAIPRALVDDLILSGMATDEDEALEKVASGSGLVALRNHKRSKLETLLIEADHGVAQGSEVLDLKSEIEKIDRMIELRDAPVEE